MSNDENAIDSLDDLQCYLNGMDEQQVSPTGAGSGAGGDLDGFALAFPDSIDAAFFDGISTDQNLQNDIPLQIAMELETSSGSVLACASSCAANSGTEDGEETQSRSTTRSSIPTTASLPDLCNSSSNSLDYSFLDYFNNRHDKLNESPQNLSFTTTNMPLDQLLSVDPEYILASPHQLQMQMMGSLRDRDQLNCGDTDMNIDANVNTSADVHDLTDGEQSEPWTTITIKQLGLEDSHFMKNDSAPTIAPTKIGVHTEHEHIGHHPHELELEHSSSNSNNTSNNNHRIKSWKPLNDQCQQNFDSGFPYLGTDEPQVQYMQQMFDHEHSDSTRIPDFYQHATNTNVNMNMNRSSQTKPQSPSSELLKLNSSMPVEITDTSLASASLSVPTKTFQQHVSYHISHDTSHNDTHGRVVPRGFTKVSAQPRQLQDEHMYIEKQSYATLIPESSNLNIFQEIVRYMSNNSKRSSGSGSNSDTTMPYICLQPNRKIESKRGRKYQDLDGQLQSSRELDSYMSHNRKLYSGSAENNNNNGVDGQDPSLAKLCFELIERAITNTGGQEFLTILDERILAYSSASEVTNTGILFQLDPTTGERLPNKPNLTFSSQWTDKEINDVTENWKNFCKRSEDKFFRSEDKGALGFTLDELRIAIDCITSRPPRRINRYPAYQLGTHRSIGKDLLVTDWGHKISCNFHCPSNDTRIEKQTSTKPPKRWLSRDVRLSSDDEDSCRPYKNIKKQPGNLYDATWFVAEKQYKEALCDHCEKIQFYRMKNSGYLYHKNYEHGIFPNGNIFEDPLLVRRKLDRESKWEGLCGICYQWIELEHTSKPWGTWYRHYKQCVNEYELLKKVVLATGAPVKLIEILYKPY